MASIQCVSLFTPSVKPFFLVWRLKIWKKWSWNRICSWKVKMAIKRAPIRFTGRWPSDQHGPGPALHRGQQQQADHQRDGRAAVLQIRIPSNVAALWSLGRGRLRAHHCQQVLPGRGTSKKKTVSVFFSPQKCFMFKCFPSVPIGNVSFEKKTEGDGGGKWTVKMAFRE